MSGMDWPLQWRTNSKWTQVWKSDPKEVFDLRLFVYDSQDVTCIGLIFHSQLMCIRSKRPRPIFILPNPQSLGTSPNEKNFKPLLLHIHYFRVNKIYMVDGPYHNYNEMVWENFLFILLLLFMSFSHILKIIPKCLKKRIKNLFW